jgi:hypothetical protein
MQDDSKFPRALRVTAALIGIIFAPAIALLICFPILQKNQSSVLVYSIFFGCISISIWNPLYCLIPNKDARWVARVAIGILWLVIAIYVAFFVFGDAL